MINNNGFKICKKCNTPKHVDFFYKLKAYRPNDDGYDYYCKACRNLSTYKTWSTNKVKCTVQGCDSPNYARQLCKCCYHKLIRREAKNK